MMFGSVCSGIEAASVATHPLGWQAAWFSEIEKFPCAVLAHHFPEVHNHGDMTMLPDRIRSGEIEAPDVLVGGTPCQAFSVAGKRRGLDDLRGNLTLCYAEILNAIDAARSVLGKQPAIAVWENVVGITSDKTNALGCLIAELAGYPDPIETESGKWPRNGLVMGPRRRVAWLTLDAQYFALAQKRRRIWIVAVPNCLAENGSGSLSPEIVLAFGDCLRGHSPSREQASEDMASLAEQVAAPAGTFSVGVDVYNGSITGDIACTFLANSGQCNTCGPKVIHGVDKASLGHDSASFQDINYNVTNWMILRRLMPIEAERLQGFPENWTRIPYRGKPAEKCPNGPRYKALGNSWAVNQARWIFERIEQCK